MSARKASPAPSAGSSKATEAPTTKERKPAKARASKAATSKVATPKTKRVGAPKDDVPSKPSRQAKQNAKPALLSGGNPQIAKGDGDGPVQAYIAAMPEWKSLLGRRLDGLVEGAVPGVRKAVKWNSPFYGVDGQGWFLSFHCFAKYVKVAFLRGASLTPMPPGESKHQETRYLDIYEADELDEAQLITWIRQSAAMPGWDGGSPRLNGGIPL
jgi:hypothetical protein